MAAPYPAREPDPAILALPPTEPDPIPAHAKRVQWSDDMVTSAPPPIEKIKNTVARYFGVQKLDMESGRRTANVVLPRQIAMYLAKSMTLNSLPAIGRRFGGKDHTTVLHSVRKIAARGATDIEFAAKLAELREAIINA